ncbi:glycosyl transferase family 2 [Tamlana sedimentorum]|uniref:Glycosyl transferase family 2 n=1 Tax=Neotamlana sedimentorum TaxID=1435349 RepID=A0A0D7WE88_9FLAO|nr:TIGR04283 family arsenosugar biosynthesis glycosyltransferase [Tamlana sedimentorum]KJD37018.1 glycosyl transferase family 2 [Tamlana sedimentorum]
MISIIIPVLNEVNNITVLLQHLLKNSTAKNVSEILIVDGGSNDGTIASVNRFINFAANNDQSALPNIRIINSTKGRAKQMNFGAQNAIGKVLYFLHADSFPPAHFDVFILNEIQKGNQAGCFRMQFDSNHCWLTLAGWFTQFSWRICRGGDQSQFITKSLFNAIGGYDESYIIYEDNMLINELYKRKSFVVINKKLTTSSRLYKKVGVFKLQYHFLQIYIKRYLGASAEELHKYYKKSIA